MIQNTLKYHDEKHTKLISDVFLGLVINTLELVNFYCTKVVQTPRSIKTFKTNLITRELREYVTNSDIIKYKHFNLGINYDVRNAHYSWFIGRINQTRNFLLMKAGFQVLYSSHPIAQLLFVNSIYAPLIFEGPDDFPFLGMGKPQLVLIGFENISIYKTDKNHPEKSVNLFYSNSSDNYSFADNLDFEKFKLTFNDAWIIDSNFDLQVLSAYTHMGIEIIKIKYEQEYLKDMLKKNKREFKRKLLLSIKNK